MSVMVTELYDALRSIGVDETHAKAAAQAVLPVEAQTDLVTTQALRLAIADLKTDLTYRMLLMTGGFVAAVGALKVFA